ncbi:alpha/beta hydrolase [Saccharothrix variisporea]|uniref:alpha/beta hydrolase n=1 Tax=Saccharothrix variisporea TaxID=543527 RepID=UPI000EAD14EC|nr:alpha/beta fold hydrolase [Saccharothrix variisporea]
MIAARWHDGVRSLTTRSGSTRVVLVPGLDALGYLEDTLAACGAWSTAHLLDLPGFGHPGPLSCRPEVGAVADAVERWLDAVPGGPTVVFGHSTGAQVALRVAARRPDLVDALVLGGPTFPPDQRTPLALAGPYVRTTRKEPTALTRVTLPYYLRGHRTRQPPSQGPGRHRAPHRILGHPSRQKPRHGPRGRGQHRTIPDPRPGRSSPPCSTPSSPPRASRSSSAESVSRA